MSELPPRPNLGQLRHQAKELLRAAMADEAHAVARIQAVSPRTSLVAAQLAIAREHHYPSWAAMKTGIESNADRGVAPLMAGKHSRPSVTRSADFLSWAESRGWSPGPLPCGVVFTSETFITRRLESEPGRYRLSGTITPTNGRVFVTGSPAVAIACLGPGPTAVVTQVEHLFQLGVRLFVAAGPAPAVADALRPGDVVVVDRALRDDGVSQHYLPPGRYVGSDDSLTDALAGATAARGLPVVRGATWTVPTPYRTTAEELAAYRAEGVLTTELSTAALFAVAAALGGRAASVVSVSRVLGVSAPSRHRDGERFFAVLDAAVDAVRSQAGAVARQESGR